MCKGVEKFKFCFTVLAVLQQAELWYLVHNSSFTGPTELKFGEWILHEILHKFGLDFSAQKRNEDMLKIEASQRCRKHATH